MIPPFLRSHRRGEPHNPQDRQPESGSATAMRAIQDQTPVEQNREEIERAVDDVKRVGIHDELTKMGFEFDHGHGSSEDRCEVWVNRKTGRGLMIEWFALPEVAR